MNTVNYRVLTADELNKELFSGFDRRQVVKQCLRKLDGVWVVRNIAFTDDWSEAEYNELVRCLINTVNTGGLVLAAFNESVLKGFVSVEPELFGSKKEYLDLSSIHVSADLRGQGIGRVLFGHAAEWARAHGAKKLYISSHSSVESQAFYKAMGCKEAEEYSREHVEKEPCDCQLEFPLTDVRAVKEML